jgi:hypothetical protein
MVTARPGFLASTLPSKPDVGITDTNNSILGLASQFRDASSRARRRLGRNGAQA